MKKKKPKVGNNADTRKKQLFEPRIIQLDCGIFISESDLLPDAKLKFRLGDLYPEHLN